MKIDEVIGRFNTLIHCGTRIHVVVTPYDPTRQDPKKMIVGYLWKSMDGRLILDLEIDTAGGRTQSFIQRSKRTVTQFIYFNPSKTQNQNPMIFAIKGLKLGSQK